MTQEGRLTVRSTRDRRRRAIVAGRFVTIYDTSSRDVAVGVRRRCVLRVRSFQTAILVAALATGCACPRFSDMVVTNPEGVASSNDLYEFSKAITEFEHWTGWRTVCVPELQVRSELRDGRVVGLYQGPAQPILLAAGSGNSTAIHEMCHAADQRLGWVSDENPDLFPVTHIDYLNYTSRSSQVHESFARACEAGPDGLGLVRALEPLCGIPLEHPGYTMVLDLVYEDATPVRKPASLGTLELADFGIDAVVGDGVLLDVASGGRLIWMVVRDPDPLLEEGNLTDFLTRQVWRVVGWSPETQQVEVTHTLIRRPPRLLQARRSFRLLDSIDNPVLVEGTAEATTHLWQLNEATGEIVRTADLPYTTGSEDAPMLVGGVVQDGLALIRVDDPPEDVPGAVQLASPDALAGRMAGYGWVAVEPETGLLIDDHYIFRGAFGPNLTQSGITLTATADGTVGVGIEPSVVPYWPYQARIVDAEGEPRVLRTASAGLSNPIGVLPDGKLLAVWSNREIWHALDQRRFFVVADPTANRFWIPADACEPKDGGMAVQRVMHVDGELWVLGTTLGTQRVVLRRFTLGS